ncbi:ROK family transcriptional regulator [Dactylosporangium darangshiense]|uniref:ROK family transcriptional regulator n=1 Tax=Dactylosporangium darangshiense TaxID=579108 RepID=A0ABP8DCS2_9ACTN
MVKQLPTRRGTNLPRMGDFNESVVLDAIRRVPDGLSRVELIELTGLSAQTVSNICRRLLDTGLAREAGTRSTGSGKPRRLLQVNAEARYAVGVHLDPAVVTLVVLDLLGRVVARAQRPTPQAADPDHTLAEMSESINALVTDSGVARSAILGLGIAAPGPVDVAAGLVVAPPELVGWGRVPLRDQLGEATGLPVLLDKDVIAAAVAERWAGAATDTGNLLFFYLGTGSGMGLVVDDVVLRGFSGNAGEVGGLYAACTTNALVAEAIEEGVLGPEFKPAGPRDAEQSLRALCRRAAAGNVTAGEIIDRWAVRVGRGVSAAATLVDAEMIVFGGPIWPLLAERFMAVIPGIVESSPFVERIHPTAVTTTGLGIDVGAIGAACLVLEQFLSAQPQSLLLD